MSDHIRTILDIKEGYGLWAEVYDKEPSHLVTTDNIHTPERLAQILKSFSSDRRKIIGYDLGCGTGRFLNVFLEFASVFEHLYLVDFSPEMLTKAKQKFKDHLAVNPQSSAAALQISFLQADLAKDFSFGRAGSADLVFSAALLDHIPDFSHFFAQVAYLLKPNGVSLVSTVHPTINDFFKRNASFKNPVTQQKTDVISFRHSFSDHVTSIQQSLKIEKVEEFPGADKYTDLPFLLIFHLTRIDSNRHHFVSSLPRLVNTKEMTEIDRLCGEEEFGSYTPDQLMESAGLSVSQVICTEFPSSRISSVLICCGPGNNGADGLVVARLLKIFGYSSVSVFLPRSKDQFKGLARQAVVAGVHFLEATAQPDLTKYQLVVDALFGYTTAGDLREPYITLVRGINESQLPVLSIDIPSGWDVDEVSQRPEKVKLENVMVLVSLVTPKICCTNLPSKTAHYLGGIWIPPTLSTKFNLNLPKYLPDRHWVRLQ